jgi:hypothetical protein
MRLRVQHVASGAPARGWRCASEERLHAVKIGDNRQPRTRNNRLDELNHFVAPDLLQHMPVFFGEYCFADGVSLR